MPKNKDDYSYDDFDSVVNRILKEAYYGKYPMVFQDEAVYHSHCTKSQEQSRFRIWYFKTVIVR